MAPRILALVFCVSVLVAALAWTISSSSGPALHVYSAPQPPQARLPEADRNWTPLAGQPASAAPPAAAPATPARPAWRLVGVMASGDAGLALIADAHGAARVLRVGAVVQGDTVLQSVSAHEVRLGPRGGPANIVLVLPTIAAGGEGGVQSAHNIRAPALPAAGALNDTSPIVPPHADMPTPLAAESGTPGSRWNEMRAKPQKP